MSWTKETGADGLPVWRGKDSILNIHHWRKPLIIGGGIFLLVVYAGMRAGTGHSRGAQGVATLIGYIVLPFAFLFIMGGLGIGAKWLGSAWSLTARADGFAFQGAAIWTASFNAIGRVEIAQTKDYQPTRRYAYALDDIPADEWQVFLFMVDGTRRVIHHASADRDGCAALAASIRGWLESARPSPATLHATAAASPASHRPKADGFDL
jgi:hypothetical protein